MASPIQVIVVMGITGVGKSTFIQHVTGRAVKVGHEQDSCTDRVGAYQVLDSNVYLLDTPGFDDPHFSDFQVLDNISKFLVDTFVDREAKIQGALYLHPVTETRMRGSNRKNLLLFREIVGEDRMDHCRLVTTKWSLQSRELSETRERELCEKEQYWQPLLAAGAQTVRFGDDACSAMEIIEPLIDFEAMEPLVVEELVQQKKRLCHTQAGKVVDRYIVEDLKRQEVEIKQLEARELKASKAGKLKHSGDIREEIQYSRNKRRQSKAEREKMQETADRRKTNSFFRWVVRAGLVGGVIQEAATIAAAGLSWPVAVTLLGIEAAMQLTKLFE